MTTTEYMAIDCGWLCCLDDLDFEDLNQCLAILGKITSGSALLLVDFEGSILAEYERNLTEQMLGRKFLTQVFKHGLIHNVSGKPNSSCSKVLRKIGFDPSDVPYVGVAQAAGGGTYLTHESKHLLQERIDAVLVSCGAIIAGTQTLS